MITIIRKELADYFTSIRVFILFVLVLVVSALALFAAQMAIRGTVTAETKLVFLNLFTTQPADMPSMFYFINLTAIIFIPIIGIALGFDAINSERSSGTISRLLTQPIFRDNIINAKFTAGISTLFIMMAAVILLIAGYGLRMIGVPPNIEEIIRLFLYLVLAVIYGAFWMSLAILFSTLFRRMSTSLLVPIGLWLFFLFFVILIAPAIANAVAPVVEGDVASVVQNLQLTQMISRFSPSFLFAEASGALLQPPAYGSLLFIGMTAANNPLSLGQSMLLVWPHITGMIGLTAICFAGSYVLFMRQEIRST
jgi:ABC-2 type transport system permease protein